MMKGSIRANPPTPPALHLQYTETKFFKKSWTRFLQKPSRLQEGAAERIER